jgi:hypothetical protein
MVGLASRLAIGGIPAPIIAAQKIRVSTLTTRPRAHPRLGGVQIPPSSEATDGGSQDAHADEDADRRQTRERDLMRELDRMTGPRADHSERARPSRAEEVVDE